MNRLAAASAISLALGGCAFGVPTEAVPVAEITSDIREWDGVEVTVHGWLGQCFGNDCGLYQSKADAELVAYGDWETDEWSAAMNRRLSIGGGNDDFDGLAAFMEFDEVVVHGQVSARCSAHKYPSDSENVVFCFDRADDIEPHSIRKVVF